MKFSNQVIGGGGGGGGGGGEGGGERDKGAVYIGQCIC